MSSFNKLTRVQLLDLALSKQLIEGDSKLKKSELVNLLQDDIKKSEIDKEPTPSVEDNGNRPAINTLKTVALIDQYIQDFNIPIPSKKMTKAEKIKIIQDYESIGSPTSEESHEDDKSHHIGDEPHEDGQMIVSSKELQAMTVKKIDEFIKEQRIVISSLKLNKAQKIEAILKFLENKRFPEHVVINISGIPVICSQEKPKELLEIKITNEYILELIDQIENMDTNSIYKFLKEYKVIKMSTGQDMPNMKKTIISFISAHQDIFLQRQAPELVEEDLPSEEQIEELKNLIKNKSMQELAAFRR